MHLADQWMVPVADLLVSLTVFLVSQVKIDQFFKVCNSCTL